MEQDIIVVGSGFSGSILARKVAELGRKVTVVEKRSHVGGNMYDEKDGHGILIQRYGPHFLNTDKFYIIRYLQQYGELFPHATKLLSFIDGRYVRLPFNFQTVQELLGPQEAEGVLGALRAAFPGRDRVPVLELVDSPLAPVSSFGRLLFDKAFKTYTAKMWDVELSKIDKYVLERVPFTLGYDERYLNKDFQYLPREGFTALFRQLLRHENITVRLNTDALEHIAFRGKEITYDGQPLACLIFTGAVDELFGLKYGALPYRSLDIRYDYSQEASVLPSEIVSYPQAEGYTRKTEYRKLMYDDGGCAGSVVATEYPLWYRKDAPVGNIPYYPVLTEESRAVYGRYTEEGAKYENLFLCGRLAEFKYYNMDVCIEHALQYFEGVRAYLERRG